jgi:hypothetical protein
MLTDKRYCYPLTITDSASQYLLACDALTLPFRTSALGRPVLQPVSHIAPHLAAAGSGPGRA